jgi:5-methylcytosine-specific restriction endonuclease McrA
LGQNDLLLGLLDVLVRVSAFVLFGLLVGLIYVRIKHGFLKHFVLVTERENATYPRDWRDPKRLATDTQKVEVFERDGYRCVFCGRHVFIGNFPAGSRFIAALKVWLGYQPGHCGHVVSWDKGGETEVPNLCTACQTCNLSAGNRLFGAYLDYMLRVLRQRKLTYWKGAL